MTCDVYKQNSYKSLLHVWLNNNVGKINNNTLFIIDSTILFRIDEETTTDKYYFDVNHTSIL